ncbi:MAG: hypothetical protein AAB975_04950 [Patescibacteria group bacterium]
MPKQWARHRKNGVGPLTLKRSLAHWYGTPNGEDGSNNEQALIGDEFVHAHLGLKPMDEYEFA